MVRCIFLAKTVCLLLLGSSDTQSGVISTYRVLLDTIFHRRHCPRVWMYFGALLYGPPKNERGENAFWSARKSLYFQEFIFCRFYSGKSPSVILNEVAVGFG